MKRSCVFFCDLNIQRCHEASQLKFETALALEGVLSSVDIWDLDNLGSHLGCLSVRLRIALIPPAILKCAPC